MQNKPDLLKRIVLRYYAKSASFVEVITETIGISDTLEPIKIVKDLIVRDSRGIRLYTSPGNEMQAWEESLNLDPTPKLRQIVRKEDKFSLSQRTTRRKHGIRL